MLVRVSAVTVGEPAGVPVTVVEPAGSAAWLPVAADVAMVLGVGVDRPAALAAVRRVTSTTDRFVKV